jgi:O-antigen/teichoic acid export membrane protein
LKKLLDLLKSKFVIDTAYLQVGTFITVGTYVFTSWLLANSLGPTEYGRYDVAYKFYTLCYFIANMGLINVTVVRYSKATGGRDPEEQVLALASFLKIYLLMAGVILTLGLFFCPLAGHQFYKDPVVGWYGWALCFMGLIDVVRAITMATLLGAQSMKRVAAYESLVALTRVIVLVFAVAGGYALAGIIFGSILAALLSSLMGFRYYFFLRKERGPGRPPRISKVLKAIPRARMIDSFSLGFFIALNKNLQEVALIFGGLFLALDSFYETGILRIATILIFGLVLMLGGVTRNLLPTLGFRLGKAGELDISKMGKTLFKVSAVSGVLFIMLTGLFLLVVPWIVEFLYRAEYSDAVRLVFIISSSHLVLGFAVIVEPFYIYANRMKTCIIINIILVGLLIPTGYLLKEYAGVTGVAWYLALIRSTLVVHFVYIFYYYWKARRQGAAQAGSESG